MTEFRPSAPPEKHPHEIRNNVLGLAAGGGAYMGSLLADLPEQAYPFITIAAAALLGKMATHLGAAMGERSAHIPEAAVPLTEELELLGGE